MSNARRKTKNQKTTCKLKPYEVDVLIRAIIAIKPILRAKKKKKTKKKKKQ